MYEGLNLEFQKRSTDLPWREAVGVVAVKSDGEIFIGKCQGREQYKMPQGGVEPNENKASAAKRELFEETGFSGEIIHTSEQEHHYDYPEEGNYIKGFRGQRFQWYLILVDNPDEFDPISFVPDNEYQEFDAVYWDSPQQILELADSGRHDPVSLQRQEMFKRVLNEFSQTIESVRNGQKADNQLLI